MLFTIAFHMECLLNVYIVRNNCAFDNYMKQLIMECFQESLGMQQNLFMMHSNLKEKTLAYIMDDIDATGIRTNLWQLLQHE